MALYVIGDVQGCYEELRTLLDRIDFDAGADRLWFAGDLINRGPRSLEVLRFAKGLGDSAVVVLGNHELHLLAVATGVRRPGASDTLGEILAAPDREELLNWLRSRPLMHRDAALGTILVHAGLAPQWDIAAAERCAREVERELCSERAPHLLAGMYGDQPDEWSERLQGIERWRFVINCFTRLRMCDPAGRLRIGARGPVRGRDDGLVPWFEVPGRASADATVVFGHWAVLGCYEAPGIYATDSGCVWGGTLSALRLDVQPAQWHSSPCPAYCTYRE
ncbi:MAG: symmetrical bis(5'-nucleosyl)-tetraphosphatase [Gammaproteobacteria bacterium]|jgi:bis(5'-nucleosyl)-tetraphosphatase (symmetrical)|nr:symmetrical bis(5'-nucleosyl)-tetraphosphatase [Gammaproteobacteria bacterium]